MFFRNEGLKEKQRIIKKAKEWDAEMEKNFISEIHFSVENSVIYDKDINFKGNPIRKNQTHISYTETDTVSAAYFERMEKSNKVIAVLNFASFKNPGGKFIEGSMAQEECLCHESFLYNVLKRLKSQFYEPNMKRKNRGLYDDNLIYIPEVRFFKENTFVVDVITCAAPNKRAAQKYQGISDQEVRKAMISRIDHVLAAAFDQNVGTLILGAFGCGVFGNDIVEVSQIFSAFLSTKYYKLFDSVVFPIPDHTTFIRFHSAATHFYRAATNSPGTSFTTAEKELFDDVNNYISGGRK